MRLILLIVLLIFAQVGNTQKVKLHKNYPDSGKLAFKKEAEKYTPNYAKALRILTNQVKQNPNNPELHYFLGYCIDRMNADDGKAMVYSKKDLTIKASEHFEAVNRLAPTYQGEYFILDPYSKLSSIWGSLAEAYLNRKQLDSAKWAFQEGKKRGGFLDPILEFNRQLLNSCADSAILITYGDNITFPIWYLQTIENFRTDIIAIDANLLNTTWYPKYLKLERKLNLSYSDRDLDSINYLKWQTQEVSIIESNKPDHAFTWQLAPTYLDSYLSRGDVILLDIFDQNFFKHPIYFTNNSDSTYNLFLSPYLKNEGLIDRVTETNMDPDKNGFEISKNIFQYSLNNINKEDLLKSKDAIFVVNGFRWAFFYNIYPLHLQGNDSKAKELIKLMNTKFNKEALPYSSNNVEQYFIELFQQVDKNYR